METAGQPSAARPLCGMLKAEERGTGMKIGILGSGLMGSKLGTLFARAGHEVIFSYSRNSKKLEHLAKEAGAHAHAGTPADATQGADAVLQTRCPTCRLYGQVKSGSGLTASKREAIISA